MKRWFLCLMAAVLLCCGSCMTGALADEDSIINSQLVLGWFNKGLYADVYDRLDEMTVEDSAEMHYVRSFVDGWHALQSGDWQAAYEAFAGLEKYTELPNNITEHTADRVRNARLYAQGHLQAAGIGDQASSLMAAEALYAQITRDEVLETSTTDAALQKRLSETDGLLVQQNDLYAAAQNQLADVRAGLFGLAKEKQAAYEFDAAEMIMDYLAQRQYPDSEQQLTDFRQERQRIEELFAQAQTLHEKADASNDADGMLEAVQMLEALGDYVDASLIVQWQEEARILARRMTQLHVETSTIDSIQIAWNDTEEVSRYQVTIAQAGRPEETVEAETTERTWTFDDLLPTTRYVITVSALDNDRVPPLQQTIRTKSCGQAQTYHSEEAALYSCSAKDVEAVGLETIVRIDALQPETYVSVPRRASGQNERMYVLVLNYLQEEREAGTQAEIMIVLRISADEAYGTRLQAQLPDATNAYKAFVQLDALLAQYFNAHDEWQSDAVTVEFYLDNELLCEKQIQLQIGN